MSSLLPDCVLTSDVEFFLVRKWVIREAREDPEDLTGYEVGTFSDDAFSVDANGSLETSGV